MVLIFTSRQKVCRSQNVEVRLNTSEPQSLEFLASKRHVKLQVFKKKSFVFDHVNFCINICSFVKPSVDQFWHFAYLRRISNFWITLVVVMYHRTFDMYTASVFLWFTIGSLTFNISQTLLFHCVVDFWRLGFVVVSPGVDDLTVIKLNWHTHRHTHGCINTASQIEHCLQIILVLNWPTQRLNRG